MIPRLNVMMEILCRPFLGLEDTKGLYTEYNNTKCSDSENVMISIEL